LYGSYSNYNGARGHLLKFDQAGALAASFDFGWDTTPAVWMHGDTYSIVIKDNHYFGIGGQAQGPFDIDQLDRELRPEWRVPSATRSSCMRAPAGSLLCKADHPDGFEWCINAPLVDGSGVVYANSEDGNMYAIGQGGHEVSRVFLNTALGAAYTPVSIDQRGLLYTLNGGTLAIVGR